jgi:hypothetical protein
MADEISSTGKWVDNETGQVVDSEPTGPEGGRLLVSPGGTITANVQRDIDAANDVAPATSKTVSETDTATETDDTEKATADSNVETATEADDTEKSTGTPARKRTAR